MAMKFMLAALLGLSWSVSAARLASNSQGPIQKITDLLKELHDQLELDEKSEQKMYNKYACWCKDATDKKASAIDAAQVDMQSFGATILSNKGTYKECEIGISRAKEQIEKLEKSIEDETTLRAKQNAAYLAFTAETKQAMTALEKAVDVLIKGATATPGEAAALLQTQGRQVVRNIVESLPSTVTLKANQVSMLSEFLKGGSAYTPQSMSVQGILKDMYTTFAADVEEATVTEGEQNHDFEELIYQETDMINKEKKYIAKTEAEKAAAEQTIADYSKLYDETKAQMDADIAFFDETKSACQAKHADWTLRSDLRAEEMKGIAEAIKLLSSDDARELLGAAIKAGKEVNAESSYNTGADTVGEFGPALFQVERQRGGAAQRAVSGAYQALKAKATYSKSLRLAALAARVHEAKAGHFDEVISHIDSTIQDLKTEEAADISKRDQCKEEITKSNSTILDLTWKIKCNEAKIAKLARKIEETEEAIAASNKVIEETYAFMNETTSIRDFEHGDFLVAKKTDQDAIALLVKVRDALSKFYAEKTEGLGPVQSAVKGTMLTQKKQEPEFKVSEFAAPDATFSKATKRSGEAKGVVSMLTMVIQDLNDEIANDMKTEEASQLAYEAQMHTSRMLIATHEANIVTLEGIKSTTEKEKADETELKRENTILLDDETAYLDGILPDCQWVFKAFFERADKRAAEMEGLVAAKEFLVGYNPNADSGAGYIAEKLPQGAALSQLPAPKFDDEALSKIRFGLRR